MEQIVNFSTGDIDTGQTTPFQIAKIIRSTFFARLLWFSCSYASVKCRISAAVSIKVVGIVHSSGMVTNFSGHYYKDRQNDRAHRRMQASKEIVSVTFPICFHARIYVGRVWQASSKQGSDW